MMGLLDLTIDLSFDFALPAQCTHSVHTDGALL